MKDFTLVVGPHNFNSAHCLMKPTILFETTSEVKITDRYKFIYIYIYELTLPYMWVRCMKIQYHKRSF